ncbi:MAG: hypothetical protein Q9182_000469 [Xanthomendoza sp. 2 TL-2023]
MSHHTTTGPLLAAAEDSSIPSRSSTSVGEFGAEMSWPSTPEQERHILPEGLFSTPERNGMVTSRPWNPATSPPQHSIQRAPNARLPVTHTSNPALRTQQSASQASAAVPATTIPPPSEPSALSPAAITSPTSPIATSPLYIPSNSEHNTLISTSSSTSTSNEQISWPTSPTLDLSPQATANILSTPLSEFISDDIMNTLETIPPHWTLTDFLTHIIDNDLDLPTEEELDGGDCAANATTLPYDDRPPFDEYEAALVDFTVANPGFAVPDGLREIGESVYYVDPGTGMMRKRPRVV